MTRPPATPLPHLPEELASLAELALDLRWSWSHATDILWEQIDPALWALTRNPWLILQNTSGDRLRALAADRDFTTRLQELVAANQDMLASPAWFQTAYPQSTLKHVAYFSMEFGLSESLPIYSGGLGILAGDFLKTASDLGVPVTGIGLLWQQGYFRQSLDEHGNQVEFFPHNDPAQLPVLPVYDEKGERLRVELPFPGRTLILRAWQVRVGRVSLYLLDSNDPLNTPADRGITAELYGGGSEMRLLQETCLGIGGWYLLRRLGIRPEVCHLNEGHAAFVVLARAWSHMRDHGGDFRCALNATRAGNVFTTHTPVAVGFDRFAPDLLARYMDWARQTFGLDTRAILALGRENPDDDSEPFNMAYLALRGSILVNAVSHLHGFVSRRIFQPLFPRWPQQEVPVAHITNGVHVPSWDSAEADRIWTESCGKATLARRTGTPRGTGAQHLRPGPVGSPRACPAAAHRLRPRTPSAPARRRQRIGRTHRARGARPSIPTPSRSASPAASRPTSDPTCCWPIRNAWSASSPIRTIRCSSSSRARRTRRTKWARP